MVTYVLYKMGLLEHTVPIVNRIYQPGSGGCSTIYGARVSRNLYWQDFEGRLLYFRQGQGYIYFERYYGGAGWGEMINFISGLTHAATSLPLLDLVFAMFYHDLDIGGHSSQACCG